MRSLRMVEVGGGPGVVIGTMHNNGLGIEREHPLADALGLAPLSW